MRGDVPPVADSLTSFCKSVIVSSMLTTPLVLLALTLVGLLIGSVVQSGSAGVPSVRQKLVLSYFMMCLMGEE